MARCDVLVSADWAESNLHAPKVVLTAGARPTTKGCKTPGKPNAQHYAASNAA